jgi:hypothetical protein
MALIVFLDFEASRLGKQGFPIEVGWAAESGLEESHLIRPAPGWDEWSADAERVHGISRDRVLRDGTPHDVVARRMLEVLAGHQLFASAPSWDGHWLSRLLRAAGLPRHALRLHDTDEAHRLAALAALEGAGVPAGLRHEFLEKLLGSVHQGPRAHRALEDAKHELRLWYGLRRSAEEAAARWAKSGELE